MGHDPSAQPRELPDTCRNEVAGVDGLFLAGDWVGPVARDGRVALLRVEEKILPFPSDPEATARAEASLREKALAREVDVRVSWRWAT